MQAPEATVSLRWTMHEPSCLLWNRPQKTRPASVWGIGVDLPVICPSTNDPAKALYQSIDGAGDGIRTHDLLLGKQILYH